MNRFNFYIFLLLQVQQIFSEKTIEEQPPDAASNFTNLFLSKLLRDINVRQNLLLAPLEIEKLYTRLQSDEYESDFELDNAESMSFADVTNPIKVCNSVLRRKVRVDGPSINSTAAAAANEISETSGTAKSTAAAADAIIINSVTLRTRWAHNFQRRETRKHYFRATPQTEVPTTAMTKDDYFPYAELPELNATALELSLEGRYIRMLVLLPNAVNGLPHMLQALSKRLSLLDELRGIVNTTSEQEQNDSNTSSSKNHRLKLKLVRVIMPKFSITHSEPLNNYFSTELFPINLTLANPIYQETHIKVSEHGIGDMERTNVLFWNAYSSLRVGPKIFNMNHPFVFLIYDSNGLQFFGQFAHC